MSLIEQVPTNVITGFLGVGKSTAIMHLMQSKPAHERWAVLVNEFGEIGIDGSIFKGKTDDFQGIFVKEVPGGCMCCTAGLPMQIALNMLLAKSRPHRLLIEPTGLGHPKEVLATLHSEHYKNVLDIQHTISLVDARKLQDARYSDHAVFKQQLEIADLIVANKTDLYRENELQQLKTYLQNNFPQRPIKVYPVTNGELSLDWLKGSPHFLPDAAQRHHESAKPENLEGSSEAEFPDTGFLSVKNQGEGFFSQGWIFRPEFVFQRSKLYDLLVTAQAERLKAVFITDQGVIAFNKTDDVLTEMTLDETMDSRIELITRNPTLLSKMEDRIMNCLI